jgi:hypothetical protein
MIRPNLSREGSDHLLDFLFQTSDGERLDEVIVRPELGGALNEIAIGTAGEENKAHRFQIRIGAHDPQEFKPVDLGHVEVRNYQVRRLVPYTIIGFLSRGELSYVVDPHLIQTGTDEAAYRLLIVNDDDV